ncbi:MAG: DUF1611 domain-containing protein [Acidobacteriota bacterium]|nr:DUF1611 domain-containing protein [Acidobacteriota bacterium]
MTVEGSAVVLCAGGYRTDNGKTAHGLVRGTDRYRIVGVVDSECAGQDAGAVLDGKPRGIPVFDSLAAAVAALPEPPRFAIVGVATSGGRIPSGLRAEVAAAIEAGLSVVNGLHELLSDDPELSAAALRKGVELVDVRRPMKTSELHFWTGEIRAVHAPRVAVLGTDCAVGKRTTARLVTEGCRAAGMNAEMIYTGQTGWLQGLRFGFILDATPNDFVSGELEHAIVSCARETFPDVIFLEGQSALRNPSGPCGSELILSAGARAVILQHSPARGEFDGLEGMGYPIPTPEDEIDLISKYGARTIGLALNTHGLGEPGRVRDELERRLQIPVACPLEGGVGPLVSAVRAFVRHSSVA